MFDDVNGPQLSTNAAVTGTVRVHNTTLDKLPDSLYIPPDALEIFLDAFAGPLDLLLYLIRRADIDVFDIPMAVLTQQYLDYIAVLRDRKMDLAGDYLLMAATLIEIKGRMLLPKPSLEDPEEEADPRSQLVQQLLVYEQFRSAAQTLDDLARLERDYLAVSVLGPETLQPLPPKVVVGDLSNALTEVLRRMHMLASHVVHREQLSIQEKMGEILRRLKRQPDKYIALAQFFVPAEQRLGVAANFLAALQLVQQKMINFVQAESLAPIYLSKRDEAQ